MDIGEASIDAVVVEGQLLMVQPQQMKNRGVEIWDRDLILPLRIADLVGAAVRDSLFDSCPR